MNPLIFLPFVTNVISKLFGSKEERDAALGKLQELAEKGDMDEIQRGFDLMVMDAKSQDKWISRARPTFLYLFFGLIIYLQLIAVIYAIHPTFGALWIEGTQKAFTALPDLIWYAFGACYGIYSGSRTLDKRNLLKHAFAR